MVEEKSALAIIPGDCFRWRARVQFIESFRTRPAAMNFAFEHGYNLIVERNEGSSQLFDVLQDPDGACTADLKLELLTNEEILVEPEPTSWTLLMFWTLWDIARRFGLAMARVFVRKVTPLLRQAASRQQWAKIQRFIHLAWYRHAHWGIRNFNKRFGAAANRYRENIALYCRQAASRYWWSGSTVNVRRWMFRHSQGNVRDLAKRVAANMGHLYTYEVAPHLRQATSKVREADYQAAFRHAVRVSLATGRTLSRTFAATSSKLYLKEVAPRFRQTAGWLRQAGLQGTFRHAWAITLLTTIRLVDRFFAAVAALYVREVAPRLRRAADRCQQAEIEEAFRRSIGGVAPPQHSNSSQLG